MIKIYFDGVLVDSDHYFEIKDVFALFDDEFSLGSSSSESFNLKVLNVYNVPTNVVVKMDEDNYATLIVDKYEILDDNILSLELIDKMVLFHKGYDASGIVPCTTKDILEDICETFGVELGTLQFDNDDVYVDYYDNTIEAYEYISYLAELNSGYAQIGTDGKLYLKKFNEVTTEINVEDCEDFKLGEHHVIERVVFDNGITPYKTSEDETLETLYLNPNNVFINSREIFDIIANNIIGFEFYNFETSNCPIDYQTKAGNLIRFVNGENSYISIAQYEIEYNGGWIGGYSLDLKSSIQQETKQKGLEEKIKAIKTVIDRINNLLKLTVEQVGDQNSKISSLEMTENQIQQSVSSVQSNLENVVTQIQTETYTKTQIDEKLTDGSVTQLKSTLVTIDNNGTTWDKNDSNVKTNVDADGLEIIDKTGASNETLLEAKYDSTLGETIVRAKRIKVERYFTVGTHSRFEDYEDGTGCFYLE